MLCVWAAGSAQAALWDPFNGYVDLSAVQAEVDGIKENSLREDYNIAFQQKLAPWVDMRVAYRYFKFDQAFEFDPGAYRQEKQPSAELRWNHPQFQVSGSVMRREVETPAQGTVITNTTQAVAKTKPERYPVLELRYDEQHSYFAELRAERDIRNRRLQAAASLDREHHDYSYTFTHDVSDNVVSNQTSSGNRHLLRWRGQGRPGNGKMRLTGNYNFSHVDQTTVNKNGGPVLRPLPVLVGLYLQSDTPDLAILLPRSGLVDGSTTEPVIPEIDLGGANENHNLGADLGSVHRVGALYVYTDRPSGQQVGWEIWVSNDNLTWQLRTANPRQVFNGALNRYELSFDAVVSRYIKAVNSGLNDVAQVFVTELEVFEQLSDFPEDSITALSHQLDGRLDYRFNEKWRASFDLSFQVDENPGRRGDRSRGAAGTRVNYVASPTVSHNFNWQLSNQWYEVGDADVRENTATYTLVLTPLETLRGSASLSDRITWLGNDWAQRNTSAALDANTDLLHGLNLNVGGGASVFDDALADLNYQSWNVRARLEAALTSTLDLSLDATHFESLETNADDRRLRRIYGVGLDWRMTRDVFARLSLRDTREETNRYSIDGLLSWNILPSLSVSAQHYELGVDEVVTTLRQSINLNWEMTRRANVYLRLAKVDLSGSGGDRTTSFQQGFRIGF